MKIGITVARHPGCDHVTFTLALPSELRADAVLRVEIIEASAGFDPPELSLRGVTRQSTYTLEVIAVCAPDTRRVVIGVQYPAPCGGYCIHWTDPVDIPSAPRVQVHDPRAPLLQT